MVEAVSVRPTAASVRPSGENARSLDWSEPGSTAIRPWAAGSHSSIDPPHPANASVPRGLNRISQVQFGMRVWKLITSDDPP